MKRLGSTLVGLALLLSGCSKDSLTISSPDKNISVELKQSNASPSSLVYKVTYQNELVLSESAVGLELKGIPSLAGDLKVLAIERRSHDSSWDRLWGKRHAVRDHYNELTIHLADKDQTAKMDLIIRVFNDGVALRYRLPEQDGIKHIELVEDKTEFNFAADHTVWAAQYGGFVSHQESEFNRMQLSDAKLKNVTGLPVLVNVSDHCWIALTEANLTDWAGMYVKKSDSNQYGFRAALSPLPDSSGILVKSEMPRVSPWRVIMIGGSAAALTESDIIANLNDPVALTDTDWIKPGKCAWDWWWCNAYDEEVDFKMGSNTETMKHFIDLAAEMGWQYQLVDWEWYGHPFAGGDTPDPTSDITTMNPNIDIPELVRYGAERGVRLWLWLEWHHAEKQMDEAFPLYEKWGIAGVKVDFMQRDDQEMVNFYHRLVKKAAEHKLMVDFHGAYKPTGFSRTYPNLLTREGIMGNEYNKWSRRITAEHKVTIPFTRGLLGEMDFTPGAWAHATPENFRTAETDTNAPYTMTMGTRCNEMAMLVVYESALAVLCDSPFQYHRSPDGTDFLKLVPTTWDDTKAINGAVGDYITVARRSGDDWYVGTMVDESARTLDVPLTFLGAGKYTATIWEDAADANVHPDKLNKRPLTVDRSDVIQVNAAPGGGQVMHLKPGR